MNYLLLLSISCSSPEEVANQTVAETESEMSVETELEKEKSSNNPKKISSDSNLLDQQLSFFQLEDPILSEIRNEIEKLDINSLTPVEALILLNEIKKKLGN